MIPGALFPEDSTGYSKLSYQHWMGSTLRLPQGEEESSISFQSLHFQTALMGRFPLHHCFKLLVKTRYEHGD